MPPPAFRLLLNRRQIHAVFATLALAWSCPSTAADSSTLAAEATKVTTQFLDLVDAGKGEEAVSRYVNTALGVGLHGSTAEERHQQILKYLVSRLGVGTISNRRVIDVKATADGVRLLVRYAAPDNPRQGTNNRRLARHNEYVDVAANPDGTLRVTGFGFADF
jgi:hypothetical protein